MGFTRTRVTGSASQNTFDTYSDDNLTNQVGRESRTRMDMHGITDIVGRGETDPDITYEAQINETGAVVYTYPNAAGNGLITDTTRP